jgi:hypothetical protein
MASKALVDVALKLFQGLGGNVSKVLGTRSNVSFLGKGKSSEMMVDMDINPDALGIIPQSKAVEELTSAMGYLTSGKLNDLQANQLIKNMQKMDEIYNPPAAPANITDMATRTRNLDKEGLMSLRQADDVGGDFVENTTGSVMVPDKRGPGFAGMEYELPPPGSRGGADDIAAPVGSAEETIRNLAKSEGVDATETILPTGSGLEALKQVRNFEKTIGDDLVNKVYDMAGVKEAAKPVARGNARDFLNTIKDMEDPTFPDGPTLASIMEADDLRFATEGGGGALGDPLLLVQKYFGPKVASAVSQLDGRDQIETFARNLVRIKDAKGRTITDRNFDPKMVDPEDFEFADGGRVPFIIGGVARMGFQALRKYGIEGKDISRLFASLGKDKSLVGKEKTEYFKELNRVLKNPDDFPNEIREIQKQLGIDPIGFKGGGLAEILEV